MRRLAMLAALAAAACAAPSAPPAPETHVLSMRAARPSPVARAPGPVDLRNAGFEEAHAERCAPGWGCTMHADPTSYRFQVAEGGAASGSRSLCIERVKAEPWAEASQPIFDRGFRGLRLRATVALRAEGLDGAGAGPWLLVQGPSGTVAHREALVKATRGWERHAVEVDVPQDAEVIEVGATVVGGGRVCVDDVRLEVLGPAGAAR